MRRPPKPAAALPTGAGPASHRRAVGTLRHRREARRHRPTSSLRAPAAPRSRHETDRAGRTLRTCAQYAMSGVRPPLPLTTGRILRFLGQVALPGQPAGRPHAPGPGALAPHVRAVRSAPIPPPSPTPPRDRPPLRPPAISRTASRWHRHSRVPSDTAATGAQPTCRHLPRRRPGRIGRSAAHSGEDGSSTKSRTSPENIAIVPHPGRPRDHSTSSYREARSRSGSVIPVGAARGPLRMQYADPGGPCPPPGPGAPGDRRGRGRSGTHEGPAGRAGGASRSTSHPATAFHTEPRQRRTRPRSPPGVRQRPRPRPLSAP